MQSTSALYQSIRAGSSYRYEVKLDIAGTEYGMDSLTTMRADGAAFGSGSPEMGLAVAGELDVSLYASSANIPRMAELKPYVRVVNDTQQSEWISRGVYYIDTRAVNTIAGLITIKAYDTMLKGERAYPSTTHAWPYTDIDVVTEIAGFLGVTVDAKTTALMTSGFSIPLPAQFTIRETLQYIAAMYGGSFIISDRNTLQLVCLWDIATEEDVTIGGCHRLITNPAFSACTGVRFILDDDTEVFAGTETGYVYTIECPWATQAIANSLLTKMSGYIYRPYSAENAIMDPAVELGDTVEVPDGAGGNFLSGIFAYSTNFDALCAATVSALEDEELDHEYPYESTQERKYTRKLQNVQSELTLQAQQIAARVTKTGGDASSFGWYLDADKFELRSNGTVVMLVNSAGLTVAGVVNATSGNIGGCIIENGVLKVANANIENLNASKITSGTLNNNRIADYSLGSSKIDDSAVVNRTIGSSAVSYGKTSFQSTLDQVGTNKANIDTLYGYFEGSAQFSSVLTGSLAINYHYLGLDTITIGGVNRQVVTWT